jgi:hypothetical protein
MNAAATTMTKTTRKTPPLESFLPRINRGWSSLGRQQSTPETIRQIESAANCSLHASSRPRTGRQPETANREWGAPARLGPQAICRPLLVTNQWPFCSSPWYHRNEQHTRLEGTRRRSLWSTSQFNVDWTYIGTLGIGQDAMQQWNRQNNQRYGV